MLQTLRTLVDDFFDARPFELAAALSYYTLLSTAPLLLVMTGLTGLAMDEADARELLIRQANDLVGTEGAELLRDVSDNIDAEGSNILSIVVGTFLTLFGASTVFAQLQRALNRIWRVEAAPGNAFLDFLRTRIVSITVVLGLGFLLLISLVVSAALTASLEYVSLLSASMEPFLLVADIVISFLVIAFLLSLLFRFVPDAVVSWRDTIIGASITSAMFSVGKYGIGVYLGQAGVGSAYGAAGSAVVFMVWVYYASLILFLGAVITRVVAKRRGGTLTPSAHAQVMSGE